MPDPFFGFREKQFYRPSDSTGISVENCQCRGKHCKKSSYSDKKPAPPAYCFVYSEISCSENCIPEFENV